MKKQLSLLLVLAMLLALFSGCAAAPEQSAAADASGITTKDLTMYCFMPEIPVDVSLAFFNGQTDIPYMSVDTIVNLLNNLTSLGDDAVEITAEDNNGVVTLTRENGGQIRLDFNDSIVIYEDFNGFFSKSFSSTAMDLISLSGFDDDGLPAYVSRDALSSIQRHGDDIRVKLKGYNINTYYIDGTGYLPVQTVSDLFCSQMGSELLYNGEALFATSGELGTLSDLYYSAPEGQRSEALAQFNYDELRMALDLFYGLKDSHGIDDFEHLFEQTGLDEQLKSTDPLVADKAISQLCNGYFADMHSAYLAPSFYSGKDAEVRADSISTSITGMVQAMKDYSAARAEYFPNGAPAYQEVGNTAYVTFDSFTTAKQDYYETPATAESTDTFGIIMYAHSQIMREGSPIENVVIDLSNNGGGAVDAAVFVIGWFLGDCTINLEDSLSGEKASTRYRIDANLDREFDERDTVSSKNLYCLTSQCSFSCGNMVPSAFKSSGKVTLLGKASGGGACCVLHLSTADGTMLQISGNLRMSTVVNGSYKDVDGGVEPDFVITKLAHFYDRSGLTSYIGSLY